MMGSRIRYTTAHVENMKPYRDRPVALCYEGIDADVSTEEALALPQDEQLVSLVDRSAKADGSWLYKWRRCDGIEKWVSESELADAMQVPSWVIDTFHALYEIRHQRDMTEQARRPTPPADKQLKREEALRQIPKEY